MSPTELLDELGYSQSPNFLKAGTKRFKHAADIGHILRRAAKHCGLRGVYALRPDAGRPGSAAVPIVYVCEAKSDEDANQIHRLVWNQDIVPFLLMLTRRHVRLYSGFRYSRAAIDATEAEDGGVLASAVAFNEIAARLDAFHAESIDTGSLWQRWGAQVTPETRVDWKLLGRLKELDAWLQSHGTAGDVSHALVGKYVYLRYLRDRGILSNRKLGKWEIEPASVFGRKATLAGLRSVVARLDDWLNGDVFPLDLNGRAAPTGDEIRTVAAALSGDRPDGQLHLDFEPFDFSHIPIETLSVIYEQFLHSVASTNAQQKGGASGAYYTPIPLVNFMLEELDRRRPLEKGMTVFDPSCGSGAFLVQCYRRLIERELQRRRVSSLRPVELRELLETHIFGMDYDGDACRVAELSLILTLLDYVDPPDLETNTRFKLPVLHDKNIFHGDFFDRSSSWRRAKPKAAFDWVVGNPPWIELKKGSIDERTQNVWQWMQNHKRECPTGGNQVAEAFAWRAARHVAANGTAALLLPAMTLFKYESHGFRASFLRAMKVDYVANFSNLAEVLFAGRARVPAAAFFYAPRETGGQDFLHEQVLVYSPFVANQEANRPAGSGKRKDTWSIVVNASELRDVPLGKVIHGDGLPWKLAAWGSQFDQRLLEAVSRRHPVTVGKLHADGRITVSQGLELRSKGTAKDKVNVAGKKMLVTKPLARLPHIFSFPSEAISPVDPNLTYTREGRLELPLAVCRPPHIILSAARTFAVYSDDFLIVPPRQIGISAEPQEADFLKALSLYLVSDFVKYHQFLVSPQLGVKREVSTLQALRDLPAPLAEMDSNRLRAWTELHSALVAASAVTDRQSARSGRNDLPVLRQKLNDLTYETLQLSSRDRRLVDDLVNGRMALSDGKVGLQAVRLPEQSDLIDYGQWLKSELDSFLGSDANNGPWHKVSVASSSHGAVVVVGLTDDHKTASVVTVGDASQVLSSELAKINDVLRRKHSQWLYFDRSLRIFDDGRTYLFKPLQRFHWTCSQALIDANEVIAATLTEPD